MPFLPSEKLSRYFTAAQLTVTDTGLVNIPNDEQMNRLRELAPMLDRVYDEIGPFWVASAYRSDAVNQRVGGAAGSYHSLGLAADIVPLNADPEGMFQKIASSDMRYDLGEIILKADQGAVHISLPTATKRGVLMTREEGVYRRLSDLEISDLLASVEEAAPAIAGVGAAIVLGAAAFFLLRRMRVAQPA